jgi:hypothetical protein
MAARMGSSETARLPSAGAALVAVAFLPATLLLLALAAVLAALRGALGAVLMATWESSP